VVTAPAVVVTSAPLRYKSYPVTLMLSVDAFQVRCTALGVATAAKPAGVGA
jgi:hypothetical protein